MIGWLATALIVGMGCSVWGDEVLEITADDTRVDRSCRIRIAEGRVLRDANGNGVVQIAADNITVEMAEGSVLRGAEPKRAWDELEGIGIRVSGRTNVALVGLRVHGFKVGLVANDASGLTVTRGDFSDNYRQRLRSTPEAEDSGDWLYPHRNDEVKWRDQYGAAVCVEGSADVTIREIRVRRGQNGIILDRVNRARVYDNDCSFLSGWGLALWRSSSNLMSRNAFDFCVRGHVEGLYNRGQDSAGILCFEQSSHNVFAENSATHGGDGFFGFAGREATGEVWMDRERARLRRETGQETVDELIRVDPVLARNLSERGCNHNVLLRNDFSYAAAHGIEMTFSEYNRIESNRLVEDAICGFWGGYSGWTRIIGNHFEGNGGMAYGLERGAINMEHASYNWIQGNLFRNNKCGVHLWWDNDEGLLRLPGVAGHGPDVQGNQIVGNRFVLDAEHPFKNLASNDRLVVLQLRDDRGKHFDETVYVNNVVQLGIPEAKEFALDSGIRLSTQVRQPADDRVAVPQVLGRRRPVGARAHLRGRSQIIMDEWGPWDHESPLLRERRSPAGEVRLDLLGFRAEPRVEVIEGAVRAEIVHTESGGVSGRQAVLRAGSGVTPYRVVIRAGDYAREWSGTLVNAEWFLRVFPWTVDPREDLAGWRAEARGEKGLSAVVGALNFPYGWGGPRDQEISEAITQGGPAPDHFGMIARTRIKLPVGLWRFRTLSDDGVRVTVDGEEVIANWSWHGPTSDEGVFVQREEGEVNIVVEHFEIDGYATLILEIGPVAHLSPQAESQGSEFGGAGI